MHWQAAALGSQKFEVGTTELVLLSASRPEVELKYLASLADLWYWPYSFTIFIRL